MSRRALEAVQKNLIAKNKLREGVIYWQITRGVGPRDFPFPKAPDAGDRDVHPDKSDPAPKVSTTGMAVITIPDIRWKRRDIKTVGLLAQAMGKTAARDAGAGDAWMVDDAGLVTEGTSSNAYIVTKDGVIRTRPKSSDILSGVTRHAVLALAADLQLTIDETPFTPAEARDAVEAFTTSASGLFPVVKIDGAVIGDGKPGAVYNRLRELYIEFAKGERAIERDAWTAM